MKYILGYEYSMYFNKFDMNFPAVSERVFRARLNTAIDLSLYSFVIPIVRYDTLLCEFFLYIQSTLFIGNFMYVSALCVFTMHYTNSVLTANRSVYKH